MRYSKPPQDFIEGKSRKATHMGNVSVCVLFNAGTFLSVRQRASVYLHNSVYTTYGNHQ